MSIEILKGLILEKVEQEGDYKITFSTVDGRMFTMYHDQDCCESVSIDEVHGDLNDLVGVPILEASEEKSDENPKNTTDEYLSSFTWTFYKLATIKGSVTIRWYGESNGYYSQSVDFEEV